MQNSTDKLWDLTKMGKTTLLVTMSDKLGVSFVKNYQECKTFLSQGKINFTCKIYNLILYQIYNLF
jgi:hypothetical protein